MVILVIITTATQIGMVYIFYRSFTLLCYFSCNLSTVCFQSVCFCRGIVTRAIVHTVRNVTVFGFTELCVILFKSRIGKQGTKEVSAYRQCRSASLSERARTEVYASVFSTYTGSNNEYRAYNQKPCVCLFVCCFCFVVFFFFFVFSDK